LAHVWNIVDEHDQGVFDQKSFATALHVLSRIKKGKEPPAQIPHEVWTCALAYFP